MSSPSSPSPIGTVTGVTALQQAPIRNRVTPVTLSMGKGEGIQFDETEDTMIDRIETPYRKVMSAALHPTGFSDDLMRDGLHRRKVAKTLEHPAREWVRMFRSMALINRRAFLRGITDHQARRMYEMLQPQDVRLLQRAADWAYQRDDLVGSLDDPEALAYYKIPWDPPYRSNGDIRAALDRLIAWCEEVGSPCRGCGQQVVLWPIPMWSGPPYVGFCLRCNRWGVPANPAPDEAAQQPVGTPDSQAVITRGAPA